MTKCKSPRCFRVRDHCQCPNSWIEFLSHEARARADKGLSRLSIKTYAAKYKKLKRDGMFKAERPTKECRNIDTKQLCKWNSERNGSQRQASRKSTSVDNFLRLKDKSIKAFPGEPRIKTGLLNGIPVIIKVENIKNKNDGIDFKYVTKIHSLLTQHVPHSVPKLLKAYFLRTESGVEGVHIMERLEGVEMDKYLKSGNCDWPSLARALKTMLDDFETCKVLHSDLQPHNVMLSLDRRGRVKNAIAFDFEGTYLVNSVPTDNAYLLLGDCYGEDAIIPGELITEMFKIYPSLSRNISASDFMIDSEQHKTPRLRNLDALPLLQTVALE